MKLILILLSCLVLFSCKEDEVNEGYLINMVDFKKDPTYFWYQQKFDEYKPDTTYTLQAKQIYSSSRDKFVIFVKPSCSCTGTQTEFPNFMKMLNSIGVNEQDIEVYRMSSHTDKHPLDKKLTLTDLPRFFLMRNGEVIYSISDSVIYSRSLSDGNPRKVNSFEHALLVSLKK
jgi:hypothetical protein